MARATLVASMAMLLGSGAVAFAAPATAAAAGTYTVPASIDATGTSDASRALQRFVDNVPNGSTIAFRDGAVHRMDRGLKLSGRRNLIFEGNGARLVAKGSGGEASSSLFALWTGNTGITIRNFRLIGNNPDAGTSDAFHGGVESQMAVLIWAGSDIEIDNVRMRRVYGDCVYVGSNSARSWSSDVWIHDSVCTGVGRNGVTVNAGRNVTIERMYFNRLGGSVMDIEPNYGWEGAVGVRLRESEIGSYGLGDQYTCWLLAAVGASGATVRDIEVTGNTITGVYRSGYEKRPRAMHVRVEDRGPRANFVFRDNVATRTVSGTAITIAGVDGVTVMGNTQPMSSGRFTNVSRSSDVTITSNDTSS